MSIYNTLLTTKLTKINVDHQYSVLRVFCWSA